MTNAIRSTCFMPLLIIETCSPDDSVEVIKPNISSRSRPFTRSVSLPNYDQTYKDLAGAIHYSLSNHFKRLYFRSYSYPNYALLNENVFHLKSSSTTTNFQMNFLGPYNGTQSPAASSSRYSLYGSLFDLSENDYHPSLIKNDSQLFMNRSSKQSTNAYQEKCSNWLTNIHQTL